MAVLTLGDCQLPTEQVYDACGSGSDRTGSVRAFECDVCELVPARRLWRRSCRCVGIAVGRSSLDCAGCSGACIMEGLLRAERPSEQSGRSWSARQNARFVILSLCRPFPRAAGRSGRQRSVEAPSRRLSSNDDGASRDRHVPFTVFGALRVHKVFIV